MAKFGCSPAALWLLLAACSPRDLVAPPYPPPADVPTDPLPFRVAVRPPLVAGSGTSASGLAGPPGASQEDLVAILAASPPVFESVAPCAPAPDAVVWARREGHDLLLDLRIGASDIDGPGAPVTLEIRSARSGRVCYEKTLRGAGGRLPRGAPLGAVAEAVRRDLAVYFRATARSQAFARADAATIALVIGVSRFAAADRIPPVPHADTDAAAFREWLVSPEGGGVQPVDALLLLNYDATRASIERAFRDHLRARTRPNDRVLLYWGGGGVLLPPDGAGDGGAGEFEPRFLPADAYPSRLRETSLPPAADAGDAPDAGRTRVIVNAGFHGRVDGDRIRWEPSGVPRLPSGLLALRYGRSPGRALFFAAHPGERPADHDTYPAGVFAHALLRALRPAPSPADADGNGRLTARELADHVGAAVRDLAATQGVEQQPVWAGETDDREDWMGRE